MASLGRSTYNGHKAMNRLPLRVKLWVNEKQKDPSSIAVLSFHSPIDSVVRLGSTIHDGEPTEQRAKVNVEYLVKENLPMEICSSEKLSITQKIRGVSPSGAR